MLKLYFVRHGETAANQQGVYYGSSNLPLTEQGKLQMQQVGKMLATVRFDNVLASGLQRAQQSAQILLAENQQMLPTIIIEPKLNELDFGDWEGRHYQELMQQDNERYSAWCNNWQTYAPPNGESFQQFKQRVDHAITGQIISHDDQTLLIVGHQGSLRVLLLSLLQLPEKVFWQFSFQQGTYSLLTFQHQHGNIEKINAIDHQSSY